MGTSSSGLEFAGKISRAGLALQQSQRKSVEAGADVMQKALQAAVGGRLRNVGKNGVRVGARSRVVGGGDKATAYISPAGPVWLVDLPTRPHLITSKRGGSRGSRALRLGGAVGGRKGSAHLGSLIGIGPISGRGRVVGAIKIPGAPREWRAYARQGGTRGSHKWEAARAAAVTPAQAAMAVAPIKAVQSAFR